eukprot:Sspe_Gene.4327::Locus_1423_Transcript_2_3_Confidence_0.500_Length_1347::g.4327::m.4327
MGPCESNKNASTATTTIGDLEALLQSLNEFKVSDQPPSLLSSPAESPAASPRVADLKNVFAQPPAEEDPWGASMLKNFDLLRKAESPNAFNSATPSDGWSNSGSSANYNGDSSIPTPAPTSPPTEAQTCPPSMVGIPISSMAFGLNPPTPSIGSDKRSSSGSVCASDKGAAPVPTGPVIGEAVNDIPRPRGAPAVDAVKFRTKVCRNWASGQPCYFGNRCAFAHGEDQIRSQNEHNPFHEVYQPQTRRGASRRRRQSRQSGEAEKEETPMASVITPSTSWSNDVQETVGIPVGSNPAYIDTTGCFWYPTQN